MPIPGAKPRVTFGLFEADLEAGQLWKAGYRVRLQSQPFRLLTVLLEKPGQVITREELQTRLWDKGTTVDFDHSLGIAVNKLRDALGDSADNPRFVETLARRGYRFIAPVSRVLDPVPDAVAFEQEAQGAGGEPEAAVATLDTDERPWLVTETLVTERLVSETGTAPHRAALHDSGSTPLPSSGHPTSAMASLVTPLNRWSFAAALLAITVLLAAYLIGRRSPATSPPHIVKVTQEGHFAPSLANMESLAAITTDGVHLFAPVLEYGHSTLAAVSLASGAETTLSVPAEIASPTLADISPDGSELLLREHLYPESEQPLWVVPTIGGSARRVGTVLAHDATWMPDGNGILYANGNDLFVTRLTGNNPQLYAPLPGRAFWLRWEPDAKMLRFTIIDPIAHTLSLWQLLPADRKPVRILPTFTEPSSECCGTWTSTGDAYVFQSSRGGNTDLWELRGKSIDKPVRLTDGPLQFESPVAARTGNRVYFFGVDARSELERVTPAGELRPERGFLSSAVRVDYSPDGQWVAWTDTAGELWRAKVDGTDLLQLTPDHFNVFLAHWSPDSSRLALMGREPGKAWRVYVVGANGKDLQALLTDARNAADPSWSPDGQSLVFGRVNDMMGKEAGTRTLSYLNLRTNEVTTVPGSENLFSPRWSPDGLYIVALTLDQRDVRLLDVKKGSWTTLSVRSGADPVWSSDSQSIYVHASRDPDQPIDRVSIPAGKTHEIVRLADSQGSDAVDYVFVGVDRDGTPLVRTRVFTGNIYYLDLK